MSFMTKIQSQRLVENTQFSSNASIYVNVSTTESNQLLSSLIPNNYNNVEFELTNLSPKFKNIME